MVPLQLTKGIEPVSDCVDGLEKNIEMCDNKSGSVMPCAVSPGPCARSSFLQLDQRGRGAFAEVHFSESTPE